MQLKPITYKQVLDSEGYLTALELWQDGSYITVSFATAGTHVAHYRWIEIKPVIDRLVEKAKQEVNDRAEV